MRRLLVLSLIFTLWAVPALAWTHGSVPVTASANSQVNPNFLYANEYALLNIFHTNGGWSYNDNSGFPAAGELDGNGFPFYGSNGMANHEGLGVVFNTPSQAERPGNYIARGIGAGQTRLYDQHGSSTSVSCTGATSGSGGVVCDNTGCTAATGSISAFTLTITVAPTGTGCSFVVGQPISNSSIFVSQFGTPTIIVGMSGSSNCPLCTGAGGIGTYLINYSQTVPSGSIIPGWCAVITGSEGASAPTANSSWSFAILTTTSGNTVQYVEVVHASDEAASWYAPRSLGWATSGLGGTLFEQRIKQANFKTLRDLNWGLANTSNCTTWATRTPAAYYSYNAPYLPASLAASSVTYNSGTDVYSVTFGSGNFSDKETILFNWPATGTVNSKISLNGNTAVPILNGAGQAMNSGNIPQSGYPDAIVYDATLGGAMHWSQPFSVYNGLNCGMPPEAELQLAYETTTILWVVAISLAIDPMTDYYTSFYALEKTDFPYTPFIQEVADEMWKEGTQSSCYLSSKSQAYIALDPAAWSDGFDFCGSGGDLANEEGKVGSTLGQALVASGLSNYELIAGVQTHAFSSTSQAISLIGASILSTSYVDQDPSLIPTQSGYTQQPAYKYVTRLAVDNYWNAAEAYTQQEVSDAWCYYYDVANPSLASTAGCASQATIMAAYMATATSSTTNGNVTIYSSIANYSGVWNTFGQNCASGSRPAGCTINQTSPLWGYEGTYAPNQANADQTASVTGATNASSAVLSVAGNGCVVGQTVGLTGVTGGSWSASYSNLTVSARATNTCTVNINSTSLGTLSSATLTYTGSQGYLNFLHQQSYLSASLKSLTSYFYAQFAANGGQYPSLFTLAAASFPWLSWYFDIYGYFPEGACSACTIASTTLTLGGTVTGQFKVGDTIFGGGVAGLGTGAGSNSTVVGVLTGTGTQAGDTLQLSQSSTVSSGTAMTSNVTPAASPNGQYTNSPVTQWGAICDWNGVGGNCGGYLLNRDLDPANDNSPVGLDKAA